MNMILDILIAQAQTNQGSPSIFSSLFPILLIFVIFYFFMIRPQMKKQKELQKFRANLKKGDRIVTTGGIYGKINNISDNVVTIDCGNNVLLKVDINAVLKDPTDVNKEQQG